MLEATGLVTEAAGLVTEAVEELPVLEVAISTGEGFINPFCCIGE